MIVPSVDATEHQRLAALERYGILDTSPEDGFDELVRLAAAICGTPIALISLVDATRQWFKARLGLEASETPRTASFCAYAIHESTVFVVPDATKDPRFAANPLVVGEPRIRFYAGAPLTSPDGYNLGTLCVIDSTPRSLSDDQRTALTAIARQVIAQLELRRHVSEREEVDRLKKDFVSTVSHELRTPLTSIRGSLGLLASGVMGDLTAEARQLVTVAERNSIRLITLINAILDFEKLENGNVEMALRPVPLQRIFDRALDSVSAFAEQEGVRIDVQRTGAVVVADETRLIQVVANLLSNAVKYSHRGGAVTMRARPLDGQVEAQVIDRGRGIAADKQEKIFDRFHQVDSSDARTQSGTGLGLAICKAIIEQHGGTIGVESVEGEGSTFSFRVANTAEAVREIA
ncbi:MAG TPA: ATP-binding protein [Thermoanaerobaculia bacterium]|nr:ATP-binding protein [Thermoanaerobaculia bacterium]